MNSRWQPSVTLLNRHWYDAGKTNRRQPTPDARTGRLFCQAAVTGPGGITIFPLPLSPKAIHFILILVQQPANQATRQYQPGRIDLIAQQQKAGQPRQTHRPSIHQSRPAQLPGDHRH